METSPLSAPHANPRPRGSGPPPEAGTNGHGRGDASAQNHNGAGDHNHDEVDLNVDKAPIGWIIAVALIVLLALGALLVVGVLPRHSSHKELAAAADAAAHAPIPVNVVAARRSPDVLEVRLPGTLRPWQEVSIYARTTGYLKKYYVDISNQVTKGDLMADIETPEIDAQLRGAQATLLQQHAAAAKAQTDLDFAQTTFKRFQSLQGTSGVTQQELDQYRAQLNSANANLRSANANIAVAEAEVKRLTEMQAFEKLNAPFTGVVTGRAYDVGSMIIANPNANDSSPLFKLAENDIVRAFIYVPQNYSLQIKKGMKVKVTVRELPGREFTGEVLGTTNYLDPMARTLMTEVKIPNPDLALLPGMYVETGFQVKRDRPPLVIPAPALVVNADGNQVALVQDNKVHFQKVDLGVDYGNEVEVVTGLNGDEQIIGNPGEKTVEGAEVKVANADEVKPLTQGKPHEKVAEATK